MTTNKQFRVTRYDADRRTYGEPQVVSAPSFKAAAKAAEPQMNVCLGMKSSGCFRGTRTFKLPGFVEVIVTAIS